MKRLISCMALSTAVLLSCGPQAGAQVSGSGNPRGYQKAANLLQRVSNNGNRRNQQSRQSQGNRLRGNRSGVGSQRVQGDQLRSNVAPRAPRPIGGRFSDTQIGGDRVKIRLEPGRSANMIRIALEADGTWMKAVAVFDTNRREYKVQQENGGYLKGQRFVDVPVALLPERFKVDFWAAKFLGVSTYISSEIYKTSDLAGKKMTFVWQQGLEGDNDDFSEDDRASGAAAQPINETVVIGTQNVRIASSPGGEAGFLTLRFNTQNDWWSAVIFRDRLGQAQTIERESATGAYFSNGQRNTVQVKVPLTAVDSQVGLELWQAKAFGVHTLMDTKRFAKSRFDGRIVTVNWSK